MSSSVYWKNKLKHNTNRRVVSLFDLQQKHAKNYQALAGYVCAHDSHLPEQRQTDHSPHDAEVREVEKRDAAEADQRGVNLRSLTRCISN